MLFMSVFLALANLIAQLPKSNILKTASNEVNEAANVIKSKAFENFFHIWVYLMKSNKK